jgi:hypothetical protein
LPSYQITGQVSRDDFPEKTAMSDTALPLPCQRGTALALVGSELP